MSSLTEDGRLDLLATIQRYLHTPKALTVRLDQVAGWVTAIMGLIPGGIAGVILYNTRGDLKSFMPLVVGGLFLWSTVAILWGLWYIFDRSPRLVLDEKGLTDFTSGMRRVYPWDAVTRATLHRTTRRGSEESAVLTLYLNSSILRESKVEIEVSCLDHSSGAIFQEVGRWAQLS
jgi:hypothetical protein